MKRGAPSPGAGGPGHGGGSSHSRRRGEAQPGYIVIGRKLSPEQLSALAAAGDLLDAFENLVDEILEGEDKRA